MSEEKQSVITKRMLAFAFIAPFLFSGIGMVIAYFSTMNSMQNIRMIALIVATFLGLITAIGCIFLIQRQINKKLQKLNNL
ncbi:MAG: hypothetical protein KAS63_00545 [Candidatus Heimdallarchaeota archaeon]|nr:hypothetical protein [Candidatus Heimdallarchaeota archaeon]MCK4953831.1 hypothetical protein [Candidatus Heimdallarchaeota archaeon]